MSKEHHEKHPGDIVRRSKQGAVLHASCQQYLPHAGHMSGKVSGQCRTLWPLVRRDSWSSRLPSLSYPWTWGEVKFFISTWINLNPFSIFTHIHVGLMLPISNIHRLHLSKQSLNKRLGLLQDQNDITIQETSSENKAVLDSTSTTSRFQIHKWLLSISHTTRVTQTTNIGLKNAFASTSGTRRLRGSFSIILPKVTSCLLPFLKGLNILF